MSMSNVQFINEFSINFNKILYVLSIDDIHLNLNF